MKNDGTEFYLSRLSTYIRDRSDFPTELMFLFESCAMRNDFIPNIDIYDTHSLRF